jgi:hypothetical protein
VLCSADIVISGNSTTPIPTRPPPPSPRPPPPSHFFPALTTGLDILRTVCQNGVHCAILRAAQAAVQVALRSSAQEQSRQQQQQLIDALNRLHADLNARTAQSASESAPRPPESAASLEALTRLLTQAFEAISKSNAAQHELQVPAPCFRPSPNLGLSPNLGGCAFPKGILFTGVPPVLLLQLPSRYFTLFTVSTLVSQTAYRYFR